MQYTLPTPRLLGINNEARQASRRRVFESFSSKHLRRLKWCKGSTGAETRLKWKRRDRRKMSATRRTGPLWKPSVNMGCFNSSEPGSEVLQRMAHHLEQCYWAVLLAFPMPSSRSTAAPHRRIKRPLIHNGHCPFRRQHARRTSPP